MGFQSIAMVCQSSGNKFTARMTSFSKTKKRLLICLILGVMATFLSVVIGTYVARANIPFNHPLTIAQTTINREQEGQKLYDLGRFAEAAAVLEKVVREYQHQGNQLKQALNLSNLSLTYQKLGLWQKAEQAISQSLNLLQGNNSHHALAIKAHTVNRQGSLQFDQGKVEKALDSWQKATSIYEEAGDKTGVINSKLNQAQALQNLGFYRRALKQLNEIQETLATQPDSLSKAVSLRSLGIILKLIGDIEDSRHSLEESLAIARTLNSPQNIAATLLELGNFNRAEKKLKKAQSFYKKAFVSATETTTKVKSQLNQLSLLVDNRQYKSAQFLIPKAIFQLEQLPSSRTSVYARINLINSLIKIPIQVNQEMILEQLSTAVNEARALQDKRAEAYAVGTLGRLYEKTKQWQFAQDLTEQALVLSQKINAIDITYLWQWQLGRILKAQGNKDAAIAAYKSAINLLKELRSDLVTINPEVQHSFREKVEPVYRELVSLLLEEDSSKSDPQKIEQARKVIESLQLAELDNFFQSACLKSNPVQLEEIDSSAAVIYPIILPDRLEVILSIPQQPLRHYTTNLSQEEIETTVKDLRRGLTNRIRIEYLANAQKINNWLLQPAAADLEKSEVKTLVFVLDGLLRKLPMAVLHDGKQFLVEKYRIAVTPGLELLEPKALQNGDLRVLSAGISEARKKFRELPGVAVELEQINSQVSSELLLNHDFTEANVQKLIDAKSFPIVHLATHGQFSSKAEDTFILTWDDNINVHELSDLLRTNQLGVSKPIELLVLSACETAKGDNRAVLGIAGVAVRAGARSTMASLWLVDDQATSLFMSHFYKELTNPETTKAEAIRRAQLAILHNPKYREHPYYWAPFILVGNWL